jgi:hypothetical protein
MAHSENGKKPNIGNNVRPTYRKSYRSPNPTKKRVQYGLGPERKKEEEV